MPLLPPEAFVWPEDLLSQPLPEAEAIRKLVHRAVVGTGTFDPGCGDQMAADTTGTGLVARTSRRCSTACARRSSTTTDVSQSMQPSVMLRP